MEVFYMKILIVHTGGTISMKKNETGVVKSKTNPLNDADFSFFNMQIDVENGFNLPSADMTPKEMLALSQRIKKAKTQGYKGVVITHGTDTLEETAYFLQLTIGQLLPVVLIGAMRSSNELGSEGLYNLKNALLVLTHPEYKNKGVCVVMNDEIHSASFVTKTHTTNVATFQSPLTGPIGLLTNQTPHFIVTPPRLLTQNISSVCGKVLLIKAYAGMCATDFSFLPTLPLDGLIIEGLGAGNLPEAMLPILDTLLQKKVIVCLVSRCFNGFAEPIYAFSGGGKALEEKGVLFCKGLTGPKARLKLLVALNAYDTIKEQRQFLNTLF